MGRPSGAVKLRIAALELFERDVRLRMPFRFGVVTLTESPQAFVRARIRTGVRQSPSVPRSAVVSFAGLDKVLTVRDGKAVEVPVTLGDGLPAPDGAGGGAAAGEWVEIVNGPKVG